MNKIVVANWKMNPPTLKEAEELFDFYVNLIKENNKNDIIVCLPFIYLESLSKVSGNFKLGAQNCHWEDSGPFTGEVSPAMLKNMGISHVILGHSERRWIMNENDEMINKKIKAVLKNDMTPILAIGERKKEDDRNKILADQLNADLAGLKNEEVEKIIFAYEPVWAIGTGDAETPEHALEAFKIIKDFINTKYKIQNTRCKVLYGGSVDSKNIAEFLSSPAGGPEIDGVLVGGASVNKEEFGKIIEIVSKI